MGCSSSLVLFFDWFYEELSETERDMIVHALEWRIDHTMNNFCRRGDPHNTKPGTNEGAPYGSSKFNHVSP